MTFTSCDFKLQTDGSLSVHVIDLNPLDPNDPTETTDTDGDGVGDNADAFPTDPSETTDTVTRAQMAVFLERGMRGSGFSPPAATGNVFLDVATADFAANFIEQLSMDGITAGCGAGNYCPEAPVNRDQMAVFLVGTFGL